MYFHVHSIDYDILSVTETRCSIVAESRRDAPCLLKYYQMVHGCTKNRIRKNWQWVDDLEDNVMSPDVVLFDGPYVISC